MRFIGRQEGKINTQKANIQRRNRGHRQGRLSIVGIGPGDLRHLTQRACEALEEAEVIIGYKTYIRLLGNLLKNKEVVAHGMRQEIERAGLAIEKARKGRRVCLISSGDPGVYGMAGVVLELLGVQGQAKVRIEIVPGLTAATAAASLAGAPLAHDFAVISLSDLLTDLAVIERRIKAAAQSDFVIVFYNPQSRTRTQPFQRACEILLRYRSAATPVAVVRAAYRRGQQIRVVSLKELRRLKNIEMTTTVIVGNSSTYIKDGYVITPRGYTLTF